MPLEPLQVDEAIWSRAEIHDALARRDIGAVFCHLVRLSGASQSRIGAAVGLDQGYVSRIIAGRRVTSIDLLERIADGLDVPDGARMALGLAPRAADLLTRASSGLDGVPDSTPRNGDVRRRTAIRQTAYGALAYALPALHWFTTEPNSPGSQSGHRHIGIHDVDAVREMAAGLRTLDNQYGGGYARSTVRDYLTHQVRPLLQDGRYSGPTGRQLLSAAAELTQLAGWQAYDMTDHPTAQRHLVEALRLAKTADDQALGTEILSAMSHQATYLGHSAIAVDLARAAARVAHHGGLAAAVAAALVAEAHAHATAGDARSCTAALHRAEQAFDRADRHNDPRWLGYFDQAYLSAKFAHCFHALGHQQQAERFAARSLRMDPRYVRGKTFNLALLASIHARQGRADRAATVANQALTLAGGLKSARANGYLRDVGRQLRRYRDQPEVRRFLTALARSPVPTAR